MSTLDYLDSERKKLWEKVTELQDLIEKKTHDYEHEAKQASKKASEYRNRCEATSAEATALLEGIKHLHQSSQETELQVRQLAEAVEKTREPVAEIRQLHADLATRRQAIEEHLSQLEGLSSNISAFAGKLGTLETFYSKTEDLSSKVETSYIQLVARKKDIDELYYQIIGFKAKDPTTGEESETTGLKQELENSYSELKINFSKFSEDKKREFDGTLGTWETEYQKVLQKIQSLLPHALTTGLSYAYSKKKDDEIQESAALDRVFKRYIKGLVFVSLIPFAVSLYQLINKIPLESVILQMPRLVLSILPLYIPILWVAYSANRKINLSKRLIEEYTHKEVLSKTFEGLAEQIQGIRDTEISDELRTRLLYNILEVSSENPGKLISDYDKSDHPLMDALDKSVKLSNAVEKISKIPGMSRLANLLEMKSTQLLDEEAKKANVALNALAKPDSK